MRKEDLDIDIQRRAEVDQKMAQARDKAEIAAACYKKLVGKGVRGQDAAIITMGIVNRDDEAEAEDY